MPENQGNTPPVESDKTSLASSPPEKVNTVETPKEDGPETTTKVLEQVASTPLNLALPVVTTTPPVTEMNKETQAAVVEVAAKAVEMIKTETSPQEPQKPIDITPETKTEVTQEPVELKPAAAEKTQPVSVKGETKIVITLNEMGGIVGIQRGNFDPQFYQVKDLPAAIAGMTTFMSLAEKKWSEHPLYPKTVGPAAPSAKPVTTTQASKPATTVSKPAASPKPPAPKIQEGFNL
jgi:hypothetical protein